MLNMTVVINFVTYSNVHNVLRHSRHRHRRRRCYHDHFLL